MILDKLENAALYYEVCPGLDRILKVAAEITPETFPKERLILEEDALFLNFFEYETHPLAAAKLEAHKKFIDVMYIVSGTESIYVNNTKEIPSILSEYDEGRDVLLGEISPNVTKLLLKKGWFCVLFPQDAHAPGCCADSEEFVKKIVGKIRIK